MINHIFEEMKSLITEDFLVNLKLNENLLIQLEDYFIQHSVTLENYHNTLVAIGLLDLYISYHQKINSDLSHDEISNSLLMGDYFYSLYYEYCAEHAFHFIKYNFAQKIKQLELRTIDSSRPHLLPECIEFFNQEDLLHELTI